MIDVYVGICACACACRVRVRVRVRLRVRVCTHVCAYIYMYMHTHTHTHGLRGESRGRLVQHGLFPREGPEQGPRLLEPYALHPKQTKLPYTLRPTLYTRHPQPTTAPCALDRKPCAQCIGRY